MRKFPRSFGLLESLISKLEINCGVTGEKIGELQKTQPTVLKTDENKPAEPKEQTPQSTEVPKQKAPKPKKEKKVKPAPAPVDPLVELFNKGELRVGQIEHCQPVENSEKLYMSKVNMGDYQRTILSGLRKFVPLEGMKGKVIVFCNLKPRPLAGHMSEGMIVCAEDASQTVVELLRPNSEAPLNSLVTLENQEGDLPETYKAPNSKVVGSFLEKLRTNEDKMACFDHRQMCTNGILLEKTSVANGLIK